MKDNVVNRRRYFIRSYYPKQKKKSYNSTSKTTKLIKKWAEDLNGHSSKKDIQIANERRNISNITNHQRNAYSNYNETSLHPCQNEHYQKDNK